MPDIIIPVYYNNLVVDGIADVVLNLYVNYSITNIVKHKIISRKYVIIENVIIPKPSLQIIHHSSITLAKVYNQAKNQILNETNNTVFFNIWKNALPDKEYKRIKEFAFMSSEELAELEGDANDAEFSSSPF